MLTKNGELTTPAAVERCLVAATIPQVEALAAVQVEALEVAPKVVALRDQRVAQVPGQVGLVKVALESLPSANLVRVDLERAALTKVVRQRADLALESPNVQENQASQAQASQDQASQAQESPAQKRALIRAAATREVALLPHATSGLTAE